MFRELRLKPEGELRPILFRLPSRRVVDVEVDVQILAALQHPGAAISIHLESRARCVYSEHVVGLGICWICNCRLSCLERTIRNSKLPGEYCERIEILGSHAVGQCYLGDPHVVEEGAIAS